MIPGESAFLHLILVGQGSQMLSQGLTFQRRHLLSVPPVNPTQLAGESFDEQVSCVCHMGITWLLRCRRAEPWPEVCHSLGLLPKKAPLRKSTCHLSQQSLHCCGTPRARHPLTHDLLCRNGTPEKSPPDGRGCIFHSSFLRKRTMRE